MYSGFPSFLKGFHVPISPARSATHQMVGHFNPRCAVCGRTAMQIQRSVSAPCERMTLPFDVIEPPPAAEGQPIVQRPLRA